MNDLARTDDRPRLPMAPTHRAILNVLGVEGIAEFIIAGKTHGEIGELIGVSGASVSAWIHSLDPKDRAVVDEAMKASAEALYDEAQTILDRPVNVLAGEWLTGPEVALRQARAAHRRAKAGIRNGAYREKGPAADESEAPARPPTIHFRITIADPVPVNGRTITVTPEEVHEVPD